MKVQIKRVYERAEKSDGFRILVDRLWPRGVSKERAALDLWLKDAAPSPELRTWFGHKAERFAQFKKAYLKELESAPPQKAALELLGREIRKHKMTTLLYGAKDPAVNHAIVLLEHLEGRK